MRNPKPISLILAEPPGMFREGLRLLLEAEAGVRVLAETGDGLEAVQLTESLKPDILVLNCVLATVGGFEAARRVHRAMPSTRILFISDYNREGHLLDAIQSGAAGLLLRGDSGADLLAAIRTLRAGGRCFSPAFSESEITRMQSAERTAEHDCYATLTQREKEILQLTLENLTSTLCAVRLGISSRTVEAHRANLMRKLGVRTQAELLRLAFDRGLIPQGAKSKRTA